MEHYKVVLVHEVGEVVLFSGFTCYDKACAVADEMHRRYDSDEQQVIVREYY